MIPRYRGANQIQVPNEVLTNFMLATSSSELSPPNNRGPLTTLPDLPHDDQYEEVELNATTGTARIKLSSDQQQQHQYDSMVDRENYNHLVRTESSSQNLVTGAPLSRASRSPRCLSANESGIFDNPTYSHPSRSNQHVDIYRLESSDSSGGSGNQTRHQWLNKVPLETHSEDMTQGLSDCSKLEAKRQISTSALPSSRQYTKISPSTQDTKEGNYVNRIVDTDKHYVSEQGHVYQVLEKSDDSSNSSKQVSDDQLGRSSVVGERYASDEGHLYHILEDPSSKQKETAKSQSQNQNPGDEGENNIYHVLEDLQAAGNSESGGNSDEQQPIYHVLEGPANVEVEGQAAAVSTEFGSEEDANFDPDYDTIELEQGQHINDRSHQSDYNVIERPGMHRNNSRQQPEPLFNKERNLDRRALLRESSSPSIQKRSSPYNVIERNTSNTSLLQPKQSSAEQLRPPNYSSLNLNESDRKDKKFKIEACNPFYEDVDIENENDEDCLDGDARTSLSNGLDNAIYHAVL